MEFWLIVLTVIIFFILFGVYVVQSDQIAQRIEDGKLHTQAWVKLDVIYNNVIDITEDSEEEIMTSEKKKAKLAIELYKSGDEGDTI